MTRDKRDTVAYYRQGAHKYRVQFRNGATLELWADSEGEARKKANEWDARTYPPNSEGGVDTVSAATGEMPNRGSK